MRSGTVAVREVLGPDVPGITDKDIQEALWHYYYDVGKSVTYLLNSRTPKKAKKVKDADKAGGKETGRSYFFADILSVGTPLRVSGEGAGPYVIHRSEGRSFRFLPMSRLHLLTS